MAKAPDHIRRRLLRAKRHIEATLPGRFVEKLEDVETLHDTHMVVGYLATCRSGIVADLVHWLEDTAFWLKDIATVRINPKQSTPYHPPENGYVRLAVGTFLGNPALVLFWPKTGEGVMPKPLLRLIPALGVYWLDTHLDEAEKTTNQEDTNEDQG